MNALFDTNVPIYWRGDNPRFRFRLKVLIAELRRKRATLFLSVVSLQEILIFSRIKGTADADCDWLAERFNFLPLDEGCAKAAARLGALVGSPNRTDKRAGRGGNAPRREVDIWQRDSAIAGTAEHHGFEMLVTADAPLHRDFRLHMSSCEIKLLEEDPVPPPTTGLPSSSSSA